MNDSRNLTPFLLVLVLLAGCAVGPNFTRPHPQVPDAWIGVTVKATNAPSAAVNGPAHLVAWWRVFNDSNLTALVEEALATNLSVQLAQAVVLQERAARGVALGALWPQVDGTASYTRLHGSTTNGLAVFGPNLYQAGFDAAWEIDVFGGLRRNVESAGANIQASVEGLRDAQVTLAAEVALNYIQLRGYQQQIVVARNNLQIERHTADLTRSNFSAGFLGTLDVANADTEVATTESAIPPLEISAQQAIYALSVLLARPPGYLLERLSPTQPLPVVPPEVPVGLPSDLLRRRPDIRQAEAQLHAATAQIGVAEADLFPKFSLTGDVTWQSSLLKNWFSSPSRSWAFGPSMDWAIFEGGSIVANIHQQEALHDQAFITYQQTVLSALQDAENQLIAYSEEWKHRKALQDAVVASRKAVDASLQLYTGGLTSFLNVLVAQGELYTSENALVQSNSSACQDLIALYKALGGGWETADPASSAPPPTRTSQ